MRKLHPINDEPHRAYLGGPRTEEGKQRSSQNAIKHGLFARQMVFLEGETQEQFDALLNRYLENHKPEGPTEEHFVLHLADLQWRIKRIPALEARAIETDGPLKATQNFSRYSSQLQREYQSTLKALHEEQAPRLLEQSQMWRTASLLREHYKRANIDFDPAEFGFVFPKTLLDKQIKFNNIWDDFCEKVIIHATTKYQDEFFFKSAL